MSDNSIMVFRFDDFVVNAKSGVLSRNGEPIPLTPKVFDTLLAFLHRPGETLSKEELMTTIWPDSFVEESNLIQNVAVLRKALGDDAKESRFIMTVHGRGYRFVPNVTRGQTVDEVNKEPQVSRSEGYVNHVSDRSLIRWALVALAAMSIAIAAISYFFLNDESREPPKIGQTHQVTDTSSLDLYPAFSPNGASIAYASNKSGAFEIYVRQNTPGAAEIRLTADGGNNLQPSFSPDGLWVAFHSVQRAGIWAVPASGGVPRRLTDFGSSPAWSPDGKTIAFQSDPVNALGSGTRNAMPPSTLWFIPADGSGEARQLTAIGSPPGGHGAPDWSPDGSRILFDSSDFASSHLWSMAADGSDIKPVLDEASPGPGSSRLTTACDAVYSRDGRSVFYVSDLGMSINVVAVDANGHASGEPMKIFDAAALRVRYLALSPDGERLVYSSIGTSSNIFVSTRTNGLEWSEPKQLTRSTSARAVAPAYSPDGTKIAFQGSISGSSTNIQVMDADGSNVRQITTASGYGPSWFPSGDRVGFSVPSGENSEYWFAAADGSIQGKLFDYDDKEIFNGKLSADGKSVLFNSKRSGTINIWRIPIEGGSAEQLTFDQEMAGFPTMSPDGRWIAFQIKRGDDTHIAYTPSAGGDIVQLTDEPGQSWVSSWGADSDHMAFAGRREARWNIYLVSRSTGEIKKITRFDDMNSFVRAPTLSPLGDKVAYEHNESLGNLWMIELD